MTTTLTYQQVRGLGKVKLIEKIREALKDFKSTDQKVQTRADYLMKAPVNDLKLLDKPILIDALCTFLNIATPKEATVENQLKPKEPQAEEGKVTPHEKITSKSIDRAKLFPETVSNSRLAELGVEKLIIQPNITIEQIIEYNNNSAYVIYIAQYWTESLIKQYNYFDLVKRPETCKKFPNDLDLQQVLYITTEAPDENGKVNLDSTNMLSVSVYTQGFFNVQAKCLKNVADGIRYDNGCEFHVYLGERMKEEAPSTEEPESQAEPATETPNEPEPPTKPVAEPPKQKETPKPTLPNNKNRGKK